MVSVNILGVARAAAIASSLNNFSGEIRSFREPLRRAVDEVVRPAIRRHFDEEGPGWARLSEFTVASRVKQGIPPGPILDRHRGVIGLKYAAQQLNIWEFDSQGGEAYVRELPERVWYGRLHDLGEAGLPQRQFFYLEPAEIDRVERVFNTWLDERLGV